MLLVWRLSDVATALRKLSSTSTFVVSIRVSSERLCAKVTCTVGSGLVGRTVGGMVGAGEFEGARVEGDPVMR